MKSNQLILEHGTCTLKADALKKFVKQNGGKIAVPCSRIRVRKNRLSYDVPPNFSVMAAVAIGNARFHRSQARTWRGKALEAREGSGLRIMCEEKALADKQLALAHYRTAWEIAALTDHRISLLLPPRKPQALAA